MPRWLNTIGRRTLAIGICDRCRMKRAFADLRPDQNSPGLMVCSSAVPNGCNDQLDPYRLPARQTETFSIIRARPDAPLDDDSITDYVLLLENGFNLILENSTPLELDP
jgi:hypothetical protein